MLSVKAAPLLKGPQLKSVQILFLFFICQLLTLNKVHSTSAPTEEPTEEPTTAPLPATTQNGQPDDEMAGAVKILSSCAFLFACLLLVV